jgi:hypothetical protein
MNTNSDFDRHAAAWLADGPTELSDRVLDAALQEVHLTQQRRRLPVPWTNPYMSQPFRAAAAVAIVAIASLAAITLSGFGGTPRPSPAPSPSPSASASILPSPSATVSIDTSTWTNYTSSRYGFTIGHPTAWTVEPASRAWTIAADAKDFLTPGAEAFVAPGRAIRVTAWAVPLEAGTTVETKDDIVAWLNDYCPHSDSTPCDGIRDRSVAMCNEHRDCHPGLLVPFDSEVMAFFSAGTFQDEMVVVAVWWDEKATETAPYGGSRNLLEAFLETMNVVPPVGDQIDAWPSPSP